MLKVAASSECAKDGKSLSSEVLRTFYRTLNAGTIRELEIEIQFSFLVMDLLATQQRHGDR